MIRTISLIDACAGLGSAIRERAAAAEQQRKIPAVSIQDLKGAGMFRAFTPRRYGGDESDLLPVLESVRELAKACPSTAWVAGLLATHAFLVWFFDPKAQDEVWADGPDILLTSSVAPSGKVEQAQGGYLLQGQWSFASGVDHCTWAVVTSTLPHARGRFPSTCLFLVPSSDYEIEDDWYVSGLRATGSKSILIKDPVFVPAHRAAFLQNLTAPPLRDSTEGAWLERVPWQPLFTYAFAPVAIGTAQAALRCFREKILNRRAPYTGARFSESPLQMSRMAFASAEVDAAYLMLRRDIAELECVAKSGASPAAQDLERMLFDVAFIVNSCATVVGGLFRSSGGKALLESNPMQRIFRDMHAITQHAAVDLDVTSERYGRFLLSRQPVRR